MDYASTIKERITARQVFERYGYSVNARGFVCCPFHGEKTPSCKVYDGKGGYHCFGCGAGGDVINLVQRLFNIDFKSAIERIDADFFLGLGVGKQLTYEERKAAILCEIERNKTIAEKERKRSAVKSEYSEALTEYVRLQKQRDHYRPRCETDELHPLFVEAITKIDKAEQRLNEAEMEMWRNDKKSD